MAYKNNIPWDSVLIGTLPLNIMTNTLPTKGNLVYEYNPLRNYRLSSNRYWYKGNYYTLEELNKDYKITMNLTKTSWYKDGVEMEKDTPELYEAGLLIDFVTNDLSFSLDHPVHITPQYSYDGSVNLIINDGLNTPRLINTRFSATGKNTYEIVDRKGNTDTNIYDEGKLFDIDTSLYKIVNKIPKIQFLKASIGGNLKVGNYHFYFKLADADGNETDFVAESGLVSIFIGDGSYGSVHTGTKNENSTKLVEFGLSNIDSAYDYITVYFSRSTAELGDNSITEYVKINKKFSKTNLRLIITGFEDFEQISATDINLHYNLVGSAQTLAVCLNMLFLGNVKKLDIPYEELSDLSLRILPHLGTEPYDPGLDPEYSSRNPKESYINANYIYNKTGYWPGELYRFGIVYILPNGELTPVFNVRGAYDIGNPDCEYNEELNNNLDRKVLYNDNTYLIQDVNSEKPYSFENAKGVCSFTNKIINTSENDVIYYVKFKIPASVENKLKDYIKGYFFVRLARIPMKLAQGITIGIDNESRTPTIPTAGGMLERLGNTLEKTHVETENINGLNYITEGFLKRYSFKFEHKSSSIWGKIGKIAGIGAVAVGLVAASVFLTPAGATFLGTMAGKVAAATAIEIGFSAAVGLGAAVGAIGGATVGALSGSTVAVTQDLGLAVARIGEKKRLNGKATVAPSGYKIVETDDSRLLTEDFEDRIIIKDESKNSVLGIICPDYTVNQPYYNLIFTGNEHYIELDNRQSNIIEEYSMNRYFVNDYRHFYIEKYKSSPSNISIRTKIIAVPDNIVCTGIDNILFRSRAGEAEEAWRYKCVGEEISETLDDSYQKINSDIVRGSFGPYLGFLNDSIGPASIVNIYVPGYDPANILEYINVRMSDNSSYHAITDRIDINDYESKVIGAINLEREPIRAYRGDCYICLFTLRINRNFNDPSAPYNDKIIDVNTWKDNYDPKDTEKYQQINLGDVNAVPMGMWVTFLLRSSNNLNIRTLDGSDVDESAMTGHPRGYFPIHPMSTEGVYKKPESLIYNKGFNKSLSERWNFGVPDVPYIKNWFGTRIMYSDIHVNDGFKNGFRVFLGTHYRDYTREYGSIVKLVPFESSLLCVFEHGIALIPVNERAVAGQGAGGNVYINTSNVLPENPKIISDMFGSQWSESILKVPGRTGDAPQYVYGVDTIAKKIWRTDGNTLECISDFKVQEFLNNNITLGERELTPKIGIRNVKTHYNAFKRDVMFTFYDSTYGFEEKVWNLCWNELLQKFITFYSWVPSYMENINNIPFSFDRNTSKWIAKLGTSHSDNSFADGITLSNVIINNDSLVDTYTLPIKYKKVDGTEGTYTYTLGNSNLIQSKTTSLEYRNLKSQGLTEDWKKDKFIGFLSLSSRVLPEESINYQIHYSLLRDTYGNHKMFEIKWIDCINSNIINNNTKFDYMIPVYGLFFKEDYNVSNLYSELYYRNSDGNPDPDREHLFESINYDDKGNPINLKQEALQYPIYKDITGKRPTLERERMLRPDKIATLLNIKASIKIIHNNLEVLLSEDYNNFVSGFESGTSLVDSGYYESIVAVIPKWNTQFLSTDFWRHGQSGIFNITEDIEPTKWYGKQHPFEFEVVVVNDPSVHKIFSNLELIANKAKPESFHYEIVGDSYDFAKDKPNMYFRLEARKALWLYNGADICYNPNFTKIKLRLQNKSADLPHKYYSRIDTINEIEDYYVTTTTNVDKYDYKHLAGAEIIYYPNRQEFRIWNHVPAVTMSDLLDTTNHWDLSHGITVLKKDGNINQADTYVNTENAKSYSGGRSIIGANCEYLEDRWKIQINPIVVCYKNEYDAALNPGTHLFNPNNSTWANNKTLPKIPIYNSPIPDEVLNVGEIDYPYKWNTNGLLIENPNGENNALFGLYGIDEENLMNIIDDKSWLDVNRNNEYLYALNRKETDIRDKFMKVRIRYSGEELAVIDFLNTIYRVSYA